VDDIDLSGKRDKQAQSGIADHGLDFHSEPEYLPLIETPIPTPRYSRVQMRGRPFLRFWIHDRQKANRKTAPIRRADNPVFAGRAKVRYPMDRQRAGSLPGGSYRDSKAAQKKKPALRSDRSILAINAILRAAARSQQQSWKVTVGRHPPSGRAQRVSRWAWGGPGEKAPLRRGLHGDGANRCNCGVAMVTGSRLSFAPSFANGEPLHGPGPFHVALNTKTE